MTVRGAMGDGGRGVRRLLAAWLAYWVAIAGVGLGELLRGAWRLRAAGPGSGNVSASYGEGRFTATLVERGVTTWTGSIELLAVLAWIAGPPLLLWLGWLLWTSRASRARRAEVGPPPAPPALTGGTPGPGEPWVRPGREEARVGRARDDEPPRAG